MAMTVTLKRCALHAGEPFKSYLLTLSEQLNGLNPAAYRACVEALDQLKHFCIDRMNAASDPAQSKAFDRAANIAWQALAAAAAQPIS